MNLQHERVPVEVNTVERQMLKYVRYIAAQLILRREEKMRNLERKYGDMISKNPEAYKKYLESERLRKNHANLLKKMSQHNDTLTSSSTSISTAVPKSYFAIPATPTPAN